MRYFILIFISLFFISNTAFAEGEAERGQGGFTYVFYLDADGQGGLEAVPSPILPYDFIGGSFSPDSAPGASDLYRGEIFDNLNSEVSRFYFAVEKPGRLEVKAPHSDRDAYIVFFNAKGEQALVIDLSRTSVCDQDGICRSEVGEDFNNCPEDCPPPSSLPSNGSVGEKAAFWNASTVVAIVLLLISVATLIILKRR